MENVKKHRDIKLVATERRRKYLVSESNYYITMFFTENLLVIEMRKMGILMNKPLQLGLSTLDLINTVINEFLYDYIKPKYGEKAKLWYRDTDSFIVYIKTDDIYKDIGEDVETRFDTSNYELNRSLTKGKNKKRIGLMKDELGGKIMTRFLGLRAKTCSYSIDDGGEDKEEKVTKSVSYKKLKFEIIKTV